jgi:hypothetical protein
MKTLLAAALAARLLCAPAHADQALETPLFTGPTMQQVPASQILVKIPGSAIQTLGQAILSAGCTTPPPTITGGSVNGAFRNFSESVPRLWSGVRFAYRSTKLPQRLRERAARRFTDRRHQRAPGRRGRSPVER